MQASDVDEGVNGEVTYRMWEGNNQEALKFFTVEPTTGHVTLAHTIQDNQGNVSWLSQSSYESKTRKVQFVKTSDVDFNYWLGLLQ